ncbi:MAG: hypothetical protein ACE5JP_00755 [Candidatus Bipolaricaulia bacterium]
MAKVKKKKLKEPPDMSDWTDEQIVEWLENHDTAEYGLGELEELKVGPAFRMIKRSKSAIRRALLKRRESPAD